ncbi:MAG: glycosyltransferase family 39 protein, partial [Planctomycetota bacterium]
MVILAVVLIAGALLRFASLRISPPGLNQDEAANAWNAYTLLKTGEDQVGASWPIFYSHGMGGNRTTLYLYYLFPFLSVGGLSIWTLRFASASAGLLAVLLTYLVAARLFNRATGLLAAVLLALSPWAIQQSRWGHEVAIAPMLVLLTMALFLWANLLIHDDPSRKPRPLLAFVAGAVLGVSCYGYAAIRIFLPVFFLGVFAVTWRGWFNMLRSRRGIISIAAVVLGVAITFGP